jgi:hypothetical protein
MPLVAVAQYQGPNLHIRTRSVAEVQADERSLVGQWCRFDYEGSRLSDEGWKKFDSVTTIKKNPEYSAVYVISRYQMNPSERVSMEASVTYTVIGRYELGVGYTPINDTRDVTFKFSDKQGDFQIVDIDPAQPSVSKLAFLSWVKEQMATTKNPSDKMALEHAMNQLVPPPQKPKTDEGSSSSQQLK